MKRKKSRIKGIFKIIILIFIVILFRNLYISFYENIKPHIFSKYEIIYESKNKNYTGVGQKTVKNQDGLYTTFTTVGDNPKVYKEYKQNGNSSWSKHKYWGGTMEKNGCGITVLSIILSGYGESYTPENLREKYYPVLDYNNLPDELLSTYNIKNSGFYFDQKHLSKESIISHLELDKPIIVCVWNQPDVNRWTTSSHYMALLATDGDEKVYISNPNRWKKWL